MLVLSRKVGERILIGENIAVTVVRITGGSVRVGIEAPSELPVIREELQKSVGQVDAPSPFLQAPRPIQKPVVDGSPTNGHPSG